ncbi:hypothetical protein CPC08DRAFT_114435 [Agrocybe pediades]|nr:hypothetical protein CPC08DRAFT_114435 [Agrocybe pediades]
MTGRVWIVVHVPFPPSLSFHIPFPCMCWIVLVLIDSSLRHRNYPYIRNFPCLFSSFLVSVRRNYHHIPTSSSAIYVSRTLSTHSTSCIYIHTITF